MLRDIDYCSGVNSISGLWKEHGPRKLANHTSDNQIPLSGVVALRLTEPLCESFPPPPGDKVRSSGVLGPAIKCVGIALNSMSSPIFDVDTVCDAVI